LVPYLKWGHRIYRAKETISSPSLLQNGQGITFRMIGPIPGPKSQTLCSGWMDYRFTLLDDLPYLLLQGKIQYPMTIPESNDPQPTAPSDLVAANKKGAARCCQSYIKSFKKSGATHREDSI
jgi:hypothetical protein